MLQFHGGEYETTDVDRLWLLRAVQAEGEPRLGVAQALVNGFAWAKSHQRWNGTLTGWIRAYAQPVNPRWYTTGDLFKLASATWSADQRKLMTARAITRETKHSRRTQFDDDVTRAVELALSTGFRGDVTDYAAPDVDASYKGYVPRSDAAPGVNRLWTRAAGWAGYVASGWKVTNGGNVGVLLAFVVAAWLLGRRG